MLKHCLEWYKWVLTNFDHHRQWFNTLIPPSHESSAVYLVCRTFGNCDFTLEWIRAVISTLYTVSDIDCRGRRYECDGGIKCTFNIDSTLNSNCRNDVDNMMSTKYCSLFERRRDTTLIVRPVSIGTLLSSSVCDAGVLRQNGWG